ncbi:hypothetical protein AYO47_08030 [Planctomyces sp. SCGC AG-212-M04]|nr:hypothetical protein AYO47_08030 [Planctomyces sp. SCGC AG-212-M04]
MGQTGLEGPFAPGRHSQCLTDRGTLEIEGAAMSAVSHMPRDLVFDGTAIASDGSILAQDVTITARRSKRGDGDGQLWRGLFALPRECDHTPTFGDSFFVQLDGTARIAAVVTEVAGRIVHFRARGRMPEIS